MDRPTAYNTAKEQGDQRDLQGRASESTDGGGRATGGHTFRPIIVRILWTALVEGRIAAGVTSRRIILIDAGVVRTGVHSAAGQ